MKKRQLFSDEMLDWLRGRVDGKTDTYQITEEFNERFGTGFSREQIRTCLKNHKIRTGVDKRFKQGHEGSDTWHTMSEESKAAASRGWFDEGTQPHNTDPIGTEKDVGGYIWVKINDLPRVPKRVNWIPKHVQIWEKAHGKKVPKGCKVVFLNGDRRDFRPENLDIFTNAGAAYYRGLAGTHENKSQNDDVNRAYAGLAKLTCKIDEVNNNEADSV